MEVKGDGYQIRYDPAAGRVICQGALRLYGADGYAAIVNLFNAIAEQQTPLLTVDVTDLQFLNSSGINALSKFIIKVRDLKASRLIVKGTEQFPWQAKSLKNLQLLMPELTLEIA